MGILRASVNSTQAVLTPVTANSSRGHMNAIAHKYPAIAQDSAGNQFAAWWTAFPDYLLATSKRSPNGEWSTPFVSTLAVDLNDPHDNISVGCDGNGRFMVVYGGHGQQLRLWVGANPGDSEPDAWRAVPLVAGETAEDTTTYPLLVLLLSGDVLIVFRGPAGSGNSSEYLYLWTAATQTISAVLGAGDIRWITGQGLSYNPYLNDPCVDWETGRIHMSWNWKYNGDSTLYEDMVYAYSDDGGQTWFQADGTAQPLPISTANCANAITIPAGSGLSGMHSMALDAGGRPMICYYADLTASGDARYHVTRWTGSAWVTTEIDADEPGTWLFPTDPDASKRARPCIEHRDGRTYVFFRTEFRDSDYSIGGLWVAECLVDTYDSWSARPLTFEALLDWEAQGDPMQWRRNGAVSLWYQSAVTTSGAQVPAQSLDWRPLL